jgi:hypothetical protein
LPAAPQGTRIADGGNARRLSHEQSSLSSPVWTPRGRCHELVLYPRGSHHFFESGKPSHRLDAVQRCVQWLERWIDQELRRRPQDDTTPATHARTDGNAVTGRAD